MSEILQVDISWLLKASTNPCNLQLLSFPLFGSSLPPSRLSGGLNFAAIEDDVYFQ
jgi:hypothetical protein